MTPLPESFLTPDETLIWHSRVDMGLLIRRQLRRVVLGAGVTLALIIAIRLLDWDRGLVLVAFLIVPVQLVAQGITRRARERDVYFLTDRRVGIWAPPSGPAARMAGMDEVLSGTLALTLGDLEHVACTSTSVTLHPKADPGQPPVQLSDLAGAPEIAARIADQTGVPVTKGSD